MKPRKEKTSKEIKHLTVVFMHENCNDSCIYGPGKCLYEKQCDILFSNYEQALQKERKEK